VKTLYFREWLIIVLISLIMLSVSLVSYMNKKRIECALIECANSQQGQ